MAGERAPATQGTVNSFALGHQCPTHVSRLKEVPEEDQDIRQLLEPGRYADADHQPRTASKAKPRLNQFVELQEDLAPVKLDHHSPTRSLDVAQRNDSRLGLIQSNPLVVDAPPKLRRFPLEKRPFVALIDGQSADRLASEHLPDASDRLAAEFDQAAEPISTQANGEATPPKTARQSDFGMLAIDRIGEHLDRSSQADLSNPFQSMSRFSTDMVLPSEASTERGETFRDHLGSIDSQRAAQTTIPQLPRPAESVSNGFVDPALETSDPSAKSTGMASHRNAPPKQTIAKSSIPYWLSPAAEPAGEKIAPSATGSKGAMSPGAEASSRPSLAERFSVWSKKLGTPRNASPSKPASTRILGGDTGGDEGDPAALPKKRSGGILSKWLIKTR
jgi:hypothetical protein